MRRSIKCYRYWFAPIGFKGYTGFEWNKWIPKIEYTKNVQGWWYTRIWTLYWCIWAISYKIVIHSEYVEDRSIAHEKNVKKYMI